MQLPTVINAVAYVCKYNYKHIKNEKKIDLK